MADKSTNDGNDKSQTDSSENRSQRKPLSAYIAEYETEHSKAAPKSDRAKPASDDIDSLKAEISALRGKEDRRDLHQEMIPAIKGELELASEYVTGWLYNEADRNPDIYKVFENRDQDRKAYDELVASLNADLGKHVEKQTKDKDTKASKDSKEDTDSKRKSAALRSARSTDSSASTGEKTPEELSKMSRSDFNSHQADVLRRFQAGELAA